MWVSEMLHVTLSLSLSIPFAHIHNYLSLSLVHNLNQLFGLYSPRTHSYIETRTNPPPPAVHAYCLFIFDVLLSISCWLCGACVCIWMQMAKMFVCESKRTFYVCVYNQIARVMLVEVVYTIQSIYYLHTILQSKWWCIVEKKRIKYPENVGRISFVWFHLIFFPPGKSNCDNLPRVI